MTEGLERRPAFRGRGAYAVRCRANPRANSRGSSSGIVSIPAGWVVSAWSPRRGVKPAPSLRWVLDDDEHRVHGLLACRNRRPVGIGGVPVSRRLGVCEANDDGALVLVAADQHIGNMGCRDDLAAGRLVKLFDISLPSVACYYVVCPETWADRPKIAAFREWLLTETRREEAACLTAAK